MQDGRAQKRRWQHMLQQSHVQSQKHLTRTHCLTAEKLVITNKHSPDNYSGITVCTGLSKLYATVLERRISSWAEDKGLRAAGQAGFRRNHRTSDNILIMRTLIESNKAMNQQAARPPLRLFCGPLEGL